MSVCALSSPVYVVCMGSLSWYWHICPTPLPSSLPLLARLRASRAGRRRRAGVRLAGWHKSPGERGDEGRQRETSAFSIRKAPGGDSTHLFQPRYGAANSRKPPADCLAAWNLRGCAGDATPTQPHWQMYTHVRSHASKHVITQSQRRTQTNRGSKVCPHSRTGSGVAGG